MTTHEAAVGDYMRYRERQGGAADPPAAGRPAPDPAHAAALEHATRLLTPAYRAEQQQRAAAAAAERQAALPPPPPPRDVLRQAHAQRAAAQQELDRLRPAVARAHQHLTEAVEARDAAQRIVEADAEANAAQLIAELAAGGTGRVEVAGAGENRIARANAEHQAEIARRATDQLDGDLSTAEQRLAAVGARVEASVCAMLLVEAERQAVAILVAADELDARRAGLDALGMHVTALQRRQGAGRAPWPAQILTALQAELRAPPRLPSRVSTPEGAALVQRWNRIAQALAVDPEAEIEAAA